MIAKICDRCNMYYEVYNVNNDSKKTNGIMFVNIDENGRFYSHPVIDLCPECMEAVRKFVE